MDCFATNQGSAGGGDLVGRRYLHDLISPFEIATTHKEVGSELLLLSI